MRLETEQEEKRLLQEQIRQLETSSNETNSKLTRQIEMVTRSLTHVRQASPKDISLVV